MYNDAVRDFKNAYTVIYTEDEKSVLPYGIIHEKVPDSLIKQAYHLFEKSCIVLDINTTKIENICDIFISHDWFLYPELLLLNDSKNWRCWEDLVLTSFRMRLKSLVEISITRPAIVSIAKMFGQLDQEGTAPCSNLKFELSQVEYKDYNKKLSIMDIDKLDINTIYKNGESGEALDGFFVLNEHTSGKKWFFAFQMKYSQRNSEMFSQTYMNLCYSKISKLLKETQFKDNFIAVFTLDLKTSVSQKTLNELGNVIMISRTNFSTFFAPFFHHNSLLLSSYTL